MAHTDITYQADLNGIEEAMLEGFFAGWASPPTSATHFKILRGASHVVLAVDARNRRVVGFINAISDGFFSASIPLLEVLQNYRRRGIGCELVRRMLKQLTGFYSIDLACDPPLQPFYEQLGLRRSSGMMHRNYPCQGTGALEGS